MNWLFKEEPSSYSFEQFTKDGGTSWAGVRNPLAQKHLRSVKKGDRVFYYHTGQPRRRWLASHARQVMPTPIRRTSRASWWSWTSRLFGAARPVTLAEIKASKAFGDFPLTRLPRLSVMPVSDAEWKEIERCLG